jgi:hypothetical protein
MTIQYDSLLSRLRGVRKTHPRPGIARSHRALCPCHQADGPATGRSPGLSVAESESGATLIHCHAGCSVGEIVAGAGLDLADLFPARGARDGGARGNGGPASWASVAALAQEIETAAARFLAGRGVDEYLSLGEAIDRFRAAARTAMRGGGRGGAK